MSQSLVNDIDKLLPQTQCGDCGYEGCMPYANAIAEQGEALNLCPPGGTSTLKALGKLLQQDISYDLATMEQNTRPAEVAVVREDLCIGCTKCIQACPVDAIVGAAKVMHTVITEDCTGCRLCVAPCPMDCIDLLAADAMTEPQKTKARLHFNRRNQRLRRQKTSEKKRFKQAKLAQKTKEQSTTQARKDYMAAALARVKAKREGKATDE